MSFNITNFKGGHLMRKILVRVKGSSDRFLEIIDLRELWVVCHRSGIFALMYEDRKYKRNAICYSDDSNFLFDLKEKLAKAYSNGDRGVEL